MRPSSGSKAARNSRCSRSNARDRGAEISQCCSRKLAAMTDLDVVGLGAGAAAAPASTTRRRTDRTRRPAGTAATRVAAAEGGAAFVHLAGGERVVRVPRFRVPPPIRRRGSTATSSYRSRAASCASPHRERRAGGARPRARPRRRRGRLRGSRRPGPRRPARLGAAPAPPGRHRSRRGAAPRGDPRAPDPRLGVLRRDVPRGAGDRSRLRRASAPQRASRTGAISATRSSQPGWLEQVLKVARRLTAPGEAWSDGAAAGAVRLHACDPDHTRPDAAPIPLEAPFLVLIGG